MEPDNRISSSALPVRRATTRGANRAVVIAVAAFFVASPALAQDDDWDFTRDPARNLTTAHIALSSGLVLAARCLDGRFDVLMGGLPAAPEGVRTRTFELTANDEPVRHSTWNVAENRTVALADYPAATARNWREGGRFQVRIAGGAEDGRALRHDVILPASSAAIGETLTACGKPLEDPRDALLPDVPAGGLSASVVWSRTPRPEYPNNFRHSAGYAVITCIVQPDGWLTECIVESEYPQDGGFGDAAVKAARRAHVDVPGETRGSYTPRLIGFRTRFRLE